MRHTRLMGVIAAALIAGLLVGPAAQAQQTQPNQPSQKGPRMGWLQQKLGLTDDQMTKIRDIHTAQRDSQRQLYQNLRNAQIELRRAALNGQDTTKQAAEVERLVALTLQARIQTLQQVGSVLTPEQREAYAKLGAGGGWHHRRPQGAPQSSS